MKFVSRNILNKIRDGGGWGGGGYTHRAPNSHSAIQHTRLPEVGAKPWGGLGSFTIGNATTSSHLYYSTLLFLNVIRESLGLTRTSSPFPSGFNDGGREYCECQRDTCGVRQEAIFSLALHSVPRVRANLLHCGGIPSILKIRPLMYNSHVSSISNIYHQKLSNFNPGEGNSAPYQDNHVTNWIKDRWKLRCGYLTLLMSLQF